MGVVLLLTFYLTPTIVAVVRKAPSTGSTVVINVLLGWTVVGWIIALAMACRSRPPQYVIPPGWVPGPGYSPPGQSPAQPPDRPTA